MVKNHTHKKTNKKIVTWTPKCVCGVFFSHQSERKHVRETNLKIACGQRNWKKLVNENWGQSIFLLVWSSCETSAGRVDFSDSKRTVNEQWKNIKAAIWINQWMKKKLYFCCKEKLFTLKRQLEKRRPFYTGLDFSHVTEEIIDTLRENWSKTNP